MLRVSRYQAVAKVNIGDTLSFVEDGDFLRELGECGLGDDDLEAVQIGITAAPTGGEVVPVSKNVRDMFYLVSAETAVVIRYVYLEPANTVILLTAYMGNSVLPMSDEGAKEAEGYISRQLAYFSEKHI